MYTKLFSRITESSLMETDIPTRYTFMMMLAIADPTGLVIGTDKAIARRLNITEAEFLRCVEKLLAPDPDSNSKELDGRRLIRSEGERGYQIVNYVKYRNIRNEEGRRGYMRDFMKKKREKGSDSPNVSTFVSSVSNPVSTVSSVLAPLAPLAEAELEAEAEEETTPPSAKEKRVEPQVICFPEQLNTEEFKKAWDTWLKHRIEIKHPLKEQAQVATLKKFSKWGHERSIAAIEFSVSQGYQGIYEENKNGNNRASTGQDSKTRVDGAYSEEAIKKALGDRYVKSNGQAERAAERAQRELESNLPNGSDEDSDSVPI